MSSIDMKLSRYGHNKMSNFSVAEVTEKILTDTTELILDALKDDSPTTDARTSEINRWVVVIKVEVAEDEEHWYQEMRTGNLWQRTLMVGQF